MKKDYHIIFENIILQFANYLRSNNLTSVVLGISGGIDSTVAAVICHELEVRYNIKSIGISMPLKNKPDEIHAADKVLEAWYKEENRYTIPISNIYNQFQLSLTGKDEKENLESGAQTKLVNGNIMARIRMTLLYNFAGMNKGLVVDTDNLTEHYLGFFTIHGDQGDYKPIGDLWKTEVYGLAKFLSEFYSDNFKKQSILNSMALTPTDGNDVSSSDLEQIGGESYDEVDAVLKFEFGIDRDNQILEYIDEDTANQIVSRYKSSEFKRRGIPKAKNLINEL